MPIGHLQLVARLELDGQRAARRGYSSANADRAHRGPAARGVAPAWPPLLATRGTGAKSAAHAHHAMHVVIAIDGELAFRIGARGAVQRAPALITEPGAVHSIDATGCETLLVFVDPESEH